MDTNLRVAIQEVIDELRKESEDRRLIGEVLHRILDRVDFIEQQEDKFERKNYNEAMGDGQH